MKLKTSISLDEKVIERIDALAAADNRARSPFLEIQINKALDELEKSARSKPRRRSAKK